jgi:hypothetical protein
VQYKRSANPLNEQLNDKNKQLTLLSQPKLALSAINTLFALKIIRAPKKFKNQPRPRLLVNPSSVNFCQNFLIS